MGLLEFLLRKIGIKRNVAEKPEQPIIHPFVDCTTYALEQILSRLPDNYVAINQAGELHGVRSSDIMLVLKNMYELAVAARGTPIDYLNLASVESKIAESKDDKEAESYYRSAIEHLKKGATTDPNYQTELIANLLKLWECLDEDTAQSQPILQEAYAEAQKLASAPNLSSYQLHHIGRIFFEMADSADSDMDTQQRTALFQKGIKYLEDVVNLDGESCDFFSLGNAQATFSQHCMDLRERIELRKKAIENLKKSYESDKDPDTLEYISEIEEDGSS